MQPVMVEQGLVAETLREGKGLDRYSLHRMMAKADLDTAPLMTTSVPRSFEERCGNTAAREKEALFQYITRLWLCCVRPRAWHG